MHLSLHIGSFMRPRIIQGTPFFVMTPKTQGTPIHLWNRLQVESEVAFLVFGSTLVPR